jgi:hypothetical protein
VVDALLELGVQVVVVILTVEDIAIVMELVGSQDGSKLRVTNSSIDQQYIRNSN